MKQTEKSRWLRNLFSVALLIGVAYGSGIFSRFGQKSLSTSEIVAQIKTPGSQVIDVREQSEISEGMLRTAQWIPLSGLQSQDPTAVKKVAALDTKKPVYIYCRSGKRAAQVAQMLKAQGFDPVNIGGFSDLMAAGLDTVVP